MARAKSAIRKAADYFATAVLLAFVALAAAFFANIGGQNYQGPFQVLDGDSLQIGEMRFRLEGIDAPEGQQTCGSGANLWPCGREATRYLRTRMAGETTICRGVGTDRYARTLVRCRIGDTDLNGEMVRNGWAVSYGAYSSEENMARSEGVGIWTGEFVEPREWREVHGSADEISMAEGLANWIAHAKDWLGKMIWSDEQEQVN